MYKATFAYASSDITLYVAGDIETGYLKKVRAECQLAIESLDQILNHRNPGSESEHFNNLALNFPMEAGVLFTQYLELNIQCCHEFPASFQPFTLGVQPVDFAKLFQELHVDSTSRIVTKAVDLNFASTQLLTAFILEQLAAILKTKKIMCFLLQSHNLFYAVGIDPWEITFEHPTTEESIELTITNEAVALETLKRTPGDEEEINSPFHSNHHYIAAIVETTLPITAKLIGKEALRLRTQDQFQALAAQYRCGITLLNSSGQIFQFATRPAE